MVRIGIDARLYGVESGTGIGRYTQELLAQFAGLPQTHAMMEFVVFLQAAGYREFVCPNEHWTKVLADFRPYSVAAQTHFPRVIRNAHVDFMHFTHFDHPRVYRAPFIVTIHDLILLNHPSARASTLGPLRFRVKFAMYQRILAHAVHESFRILTPSQTVKDQIVKRFGVLPEKVIPTYLGIDHRGGGSTSGAGERRNRAVPPYLLYIGNAYPHKNVEQLIRVMPEARKRIPGLRLVLVGREDDFSRRLRREVVAHDFPHDAVVFFGPATDEERTQLLRGAAAYVTASFDEGFALPPVEALALDTPVIASDIPIHREILADAALFFTKNNDKSLVEQIVTTITSRGSYDTIERTKRAHRFTWGACVQETLLAYREVTTLLRARSPATPWPHVEPPNAPQHVRGEP
ncbi:MAG: glycosyltransferase family 1 protein [bacterium]|nr:glycosyltransferase family 1 protein [bacterium]